MYASIAQHPCITRLTMPQISEDWTYEAVRTVDRPFQCLTYLRTDLLEQQFMILAPHLKNLTWLTIEIDGPSNSALQSLQHMPHLQHLHLSFTGDPDLCFIKGEDLLDAARYCGNLDTVTIGDMDDGCPVADDVTDETLRELAQSLPKLDRLNLHLQDASLTEDAVRYLGRCCKTLRWLALCADVDFAKLTRSGSSGLFPKMENMFITRPDPEEMLVSPPEKVERLAKRIWRMMPKCDSFQSGYSAVIDHSGNEGPHLDSLVEELGTTSMYD